MTEKKREKAELEAQLTQRSGELRTEEQKQKMEVDKINDLQRELNIQKQELQSSTTEFDEIQLSLLHNIVALEPVLDAQCRNKGRTVADQGRAARQAYKEKIVSQGLEGIIADQELIM